jgi:hypothetical protein
VEAALLAIVALACPLGMLLMGVSMWKGVGPKRANKANPDLGDLRTEHKRLSREIARLERTQTPDADEVAQR